MVLWWHLQSRFRGCGMHAGVCPCTRNRSLRSTGLLKVQRCICWWQPIYPQLEHGPARVPALVCAEGCWATGG